MKCFVKNCKNGDKRHPLGVTFHKIPKNRQQEWLEAIKRPLDTIVGHQRVCSEHFLDDQFYKSHGRRTLKEGAVPSQLIERDASKVGVATSSLLMKQWLDASFSKPELSQRLTEPSKHDEEKPGTSSGAAGDKHTFTKPQIAEVVKAPVRRVLFELGSVPTDEYADEGCSEVKNGKSGATIIGEEHEERQSAKSTTSSPSSSIGSSVKGKRLSTTKIHSYSVSQKQMGESRKRKASSSSASTASSLKRKRQYIKTIHSYSLSPYNYVKTINRQKTKIGAYKTKLKRARETCARKRKQIRHLKEITNDLRKRVMVTTSAVEQLEQSFSGIPRTIMSRMLRQNKRGNVNRDTYPEELRTFAMTLQFYSTKAYEYVRRTFDFALPHQATIRRWMTKINCEPGFSSPSMELLKAKVKEFNESQKGTTGQLLGALMLDSMSIKKEITVEPNTLRTRGYVDFGTGEPQAGDLTPATEVLVLMVVGINSNFKVPVAYFFVNKLSGEEISNLVLEALRIIHPTGITILSITCDGPQVHFKMMKCLGCKITDTNDLQSWFVHPITKAKVYVVFDICHMLKLVRNNWEKLEQFRDADGGIVDWQFIRRLHEIQETEGLYLANKLRRKHIEFRKKIMKVRLAAQTLSSSVADALEFLKDDLLLDEFQNAGATINFLRKIDGLFDLLNSRCPFGKGYKTPLREANEAFWRPFLVDSIQYLGQCTTMTGQLLYQTRHKVPFIGFVVSSTSFLQMYDDEVRTKGTLQYMLTYKWSQDHLELFFCSVRSRNGWMSNPNCSQFIHTYKRLLMHQDLLNATGNCVAQDQTTTLTLTSTQQVLSLSDVTLIRGYARDEEIDELLSEIQISLPVHLSEYADNVVAYICGYVIRMLQRQIRCSTCLEALLFDEADDDLNAYHLIHRKNKGGLLLPSRSLQHVCMGTEKTIQAVYKHFDNKIPNHKIFIQLLLKDAQKYITDSRCFSCLEEHLLDATVFDEIHKKTLIHRIITNYAKIRLHSLAARMNTALTDGKSRQTLWRTIIFQHL